jgi:phage repressor protein C with HTH and peptisase S24 domain
MASSAAAARKRIEPDLPERVTRRLTQLKRSPIVAATSVGLERNYLRDLSAGRKLTISQKHLPKVASALDWSVAQLLGAESLNTRQDYTAETTAIPEIDLKAGASYAGGLPEEEVVLDEHGHALTGAMVRTTWGIPAPFLRDELRVRSTRAHILPIRGDSMAETLFDGDRVIIDLDDTDVSQGGIFALVDDDGTVIVKQVELVRGGGGRRRILCTSRNPSYKAFELALEEPVRIIGRVASRITRL